MKTLRNSVGLDMMDGWSIRLSWGGVGKTNVTTSRRPRRQPFVEVAGGFDEIEWAGLEYNSGLGTVVQSLLARQDLQGFGCVVRFGMRA